MANYSPSVQAGTGAKTNFVLPWTYLDVSHVSAKVNGTPTAFTWVDASTIQISPAPANGAQVVIYRTTPGDVLVNFSSGFVRSSDQNYAYKQPLFRADEVQADVALLNTTATAAAAAAAASATAAATSLSDLLAAGKIVRSGSGAPSNGLGNNGDFYINTANWNIYGPKASGAWPAGVSLVGATGATGAAGSTGSQGIQGIQGIQGTTGSTGATGAAGSIWRSGAGAPAGGTGVITDWYLNVTNGDVYEKTGASTWTLRDNLTGPTGPTGSTGATGSAGSNGTNGAPGAVWRDGSGVPSNALGIDGDYYLNVATSDVYKRASGTYSIVVNIKGASGAGSGDVVGPAGAVGSNFAAFNSTTGKLILDSGVSAASFAAAIHSHAISDVTGLTAALAALQAADADLDAIAALSGTTGFLKKTAANTWALDTSSYLTSLGIGSSTQAWDADLDAIAALSAVGGILKKTAANTWALDGASIIVTAAGTTTLTAASNSIQQFTGTAAQTVTLPVASTLTLGWSVNILNSSTGTVSVNSSGANLVGTAQTGGTNAMYTCVLTSGTSAASWVQNCDGATTRTGTGSLVYSVSPAFTSTPTAPSAARFTNTTQIATTAQVYDTVTNIPANAQTGTTYTFVATDRGKMVTLTNAASIAATINNSIHTANDVINVSQGGAGQVTFVAGSGVTIKSSGSKLKLTGQYSGAVLWFESAAIAWLIGDIAT